MIHVKPEQAAAASHLSQHHSPHPHRSTEQSSLQNLFANTVQLASCFNLSESFYELDNPVTDITSDLLDKLSHFGEGRGGIELSQQEVSTLIDTHKAVFAATRANSEAGGASPSPVAVIEVFIKSFIAQQVSPARAIHLVRGIHRILFTDGRAVSQANHREDIAQEVKEVQDIQDSVIADMSDPGGVSIESDFIQQEASNTAMEQHIKRAAIETYRELQAWDQEKQHWRDRQRDSESRKQSPITIAQAGDDGEG